MQELCVVHLFLESEGAVVVDRRHQKEVLLNDDPQVQLVEVLERVLMVGRRILSPYGHQLILWPKEPDGLQVGQISEVQVIQDGEDDHYDDRLQEGALPDRRHHHVQQLEPQ